MEGVRKLLSPLSIHCHTTYVHCLSRCSGSNSPMIPLWSSIQERKSFTDRSMSISLSKVHVCHNYMYALCPSTNCNALVHHNLWFHRCDGVLWTTPTVRNLLQASFPFVRLTWLGQSTSFILRTTQGTSHLMWGSF